MSFPNRVIFKQNQSQLGRLPVNNDYISGLHFYGAYPSGFSDSKKTIPFLSLTQAENAGITNTHSGETAAHAVYTITAIGTGGTTNIQLLVQEPFDSVVLCNYTQVTSDKGDATSGALATSLANAINAGTKTHGYSATATGTSTGVLTIHARPGLGIFLNSGSPLSTVITSAGSYVATITTAFTGGVASILDIWHYHIAEYFRLMPNGKVFVTVNNTFDNTFPDIKAAQAFAQGAIRQFGIYTDQTFNAGFVLAAKAVKNYLFGINQPAEIWLAMDISGMDDVGASDGLPDLSTSNSAGVGVVVGQDGAALGGSLFYAYGRSVTTLGTTLGATSNAPVNVDIGWVQQYNLTDGTELNVPAFANGQLYSEVFNSENNALTQIDNYRYNFIMSYSGQVGTYFNDDKTATSPTDSFANMNDNRVIDKVQRVVYANLLPLVNGPIELNADGTIPPLTLANLDSLARNPMEIMARAGEIAGDEHGNIAAGAVQIDPNQNVVVNNGITIAVTPTENGTARQILVPIGYAN